MRIRKEGKVLYVPMRAEGNGIIGDAIIEVKPGDKDYQKYLTRYESESKRLDSGPKYFS